MTIIISLIIMILQSWRIVIWRWNCSSNATTEAFSTFQIRLDLIAAIIWLQCLLHRLQNNRQRLWRMAQHAMVFTAKCGLTSKALKKTERHLAFMIPNALSITERALAWCLLNLTSTGFLTGSLYGVMRVMGWEVQGYPLSPRIWKPSGGYIWSTKRGLFLKTLASWTEPG